MKTAPSRGCRASLGLALTALIALLAASPALADSEDGTARYGYNVVGFDYDATGDLNGGRDSGTCRAGWTSGWAGHVSTGEEASDLSPLSFGRGSMKIGHHGTKGTVTATMPVTSTLSDGFHLVESVCDDLSTPFQDESQEDVTQCSDPTGTKSDLTATARISGGVGDRVKLTWSFKTATAPGYLVPNSFSCVEPFEFGQLPTCESKSKLGKLTGKKATLPFNCLYSSSTPPAGRDYTSYTTFSYGNGALRLKRTKQD